MSRLAKLRSELTKRGVDGIVILRPENRRYMSGFTGSSAVLLVTAGEALLFTDFRYIEQATAQAPEFTIIKHEQLIWDSVAQYIPAGKLAFEQDFVTFEQYKLFTEKFINIELIPSTGVVEGLRSIKDAGELAELQKAADLADQAFTHILGYIKPGVTEREIAMELEFFMRQRGASGPSFDFIVASGPRSSLPHGVAGNRVINQGEYVKMDFGCVVNGYCSDITRTVVLGEPNAKQQKIYEIVLKAQLEALKAVKPGRTGVEVDKVARDIISAEGYADNFGHGLGHSVGLAIHEEPRLSPTGDKLLQPGMVVTVEPGIYLPDWGGVRIEDTVVVTEQGCRTLTVSTKDLIKL